MVIRIRFRYYTLPVNHTQYTKNKWWRHGKMFEIIKVPIGEVPPLHETDIFRWTVSRNITLRLIQRCWAVHTCFITGQLPIHLQTALNTLQATGTEARGGSLRQQSHSPPRFKWSFSKSKPACLTHQSWKFCLKQKVAGLSLLWRCYVPF